MSDTYKSRTMALDQFWSAECGDGLLVSRRAVEELANEADARIAELTEALRVARVNDDRYQEVRARISAGRSMPGSPVEFCMRLPRVPHNVMQGSVAQHFDIAIDSARAATKPASPDKEPTA